MSVTITTVLIVATASVVASALQLLAARVAAERLLAPAYASSRPSVSPLSDQDA